MGMENAVRSQLSRFEQLQFAREVLLVEAGALNSLAANLPSAFETAVDLIYDCQGSVIVTGMGKAGIIGQKVAATLASTGTPSHFLHPAEAFHGDLGRLRQGDVALALSSSGQTEEMTRLLPTIRDMGLPLIVLTNYAGSALGRAATATLSLGEMREACPLGLAPSTSTTAMLALGDALALVVSRMRGFAATDFARFHPGGSLGRKLAKVADVMRPLGECRVALQTHTARQVLVDVGRPGRRTGAIMLTDAKGRLRGLFTDSDLARLLESGREAELDEPMSHLMSVSPATVSVEASMSAAVTILADKKISELPVIDEHGYPCGLVDITDVVGGAPALEDDHGVQGDSTRITVPFPHRSNTKAPA